jgi:hypothetical protein
LTELQASSGSPQLPIAAAVVTTLNPRGYPSAIDVAPICTLVHTMAVQELRMLIRNARRAAGCQITEDHVGAA